MEKRKGKEEWKKKNSLLTHTHNNKTDQRLGFGKTRERKYLDK
jgi:hypothetical protein